MADQKIERKKENKLVKELDECSFTPQLVTHGYKSPHAFKSYNNPSKHADHLIQQLNDKIKTSKQKIEERQYDKEKKEMAECTFKPSINSMIPARKQSY